MCTVHIILIPGPRLCVLISPSVCSRCAVAERVHIKAELGEIFLSTKIDERGITMTYMYRKAM